MCRTAEEWRNVEEWQIGIGGVNEDLVHFKDAVICCVRYAGRGKRLGKERIKATV